MHRQTTRARATVLVRLHGRFPTQSSAVPPGYTFQPPSSHRQNRSHSFTTAAHTRTILQVSKTHSATRTCIRRLEAADQRPLSHPTIWDLHGSVNIDSPQSSTFLPRSPRRISRRERPYAARLCGLWPQRRSLYAIATDMPPSLRSAPMPRLPHSTCPSCRQGHGEEGGRGCNHQSARAPSVPPPSIAPSRGWRSPSR